MRFNTEAIRERLESHRIIVIKDFISLRKCSLMLQQLSLCVWQPSGILKPRKRSSRSLEVVYSDIRSSYTVSESIFTPNLKEEIRSLDKKIARVIDTDVHKLEPWQALNYEVGEEFRFHLDGGADFALQRAGERVRSILLYLGVPEEGGETHFRTLDIKVKPEVGKLVVWNNLLPSGLPDYAMIHAGLPVRRGSKTVLVTWERQRNCT